MTTDAPNPGAQVEADAALLGLIRQRDESALAMLYDTRGQMLYSLALSIVGNTADAEEVTQEVFLKVWNKAEVFDPARGSALAWLVTMARRLAIDKTRSRQHKSRGREVSIDDTAGAAPRPEAAVAGELVTAGVQAREVLDALERLDENHREVIRLSYFEGLSHSKIASHLNTPLGTVKSRIREAVGQLRRILDVKG